MTEHPTYQISHYSDLREPEYENGPLVSHAAYRESGIYLLFRGVGSREPDSQIVRWRLEAPANTRKLLDKRWTDRSMIFERVIQYMSDVPQPYHRQSKKRAMAGYQLTSRKLEAGFQQS